MSAVYAALPHPDGMKKGSSWEGVALPSPPTGWGAWGNPVSPYPCVRAAPSPSRVGGVGKPGFPLPLRAGQALPRAGRGETRFPPTPACGLRPHPPAGGGVGQSGFGSPVSPYPWVRAAPAQTLSRAGGRGNPVAPSPCGRAWPVPTLLRAGCGATPLPHTPAPEDDVQPSKCSGDLVAQRRRGVQAAAPGARAPRFVEHQH